jgi:hypothetical protein
VHVLAVEFRDHPVDLIVCRFVIGIDKAVGVAVQTIIVQDRSNFSSRGRSDECVRLQGRFSLLVVGREIGLEVVEVLQRNGDGCKDSGHMVGGNMPVNRTFLYFRRVTSS